MTNKTLQHRRNNNSNVHTASNVPTGIIPQPTTSGSSGSLGSIVKESIASGFGSGLGFSFAERAVSSIFGPRTVSVSHITQPVRDERCQEEEKKYISCIKTQKYMENIHPCKEEMDAFYQCNNISTTR